MRVVVSEGIIAAKNSLNEILLGHSYFFQDKVIAMIVTTTTSFLEHIQEVLVILVFINIGPSIKGLQSF
jgi:hypothetical protein